MYSIVNLSYSSGSGKYLNFFMFFLLCNVLNLFLNFPYLIQVFKGPMCNIYCDLLA